jgi:hypothetical protein
VTQNAPVTKPRGRASSTVIKAIQHLPTALPRRPNAVRRPFQGANLFLDPGESTQRVSGAKHAGLKSATLNRHVFAEVQCERKRPERGRAALPLLSLEGGPSVYSSAADPGSFGVRVGGRQRFWGRWPRSLITYFYGPALASPRGFAASRWGGGGEGGWASWQPFLATNKTVARQATARAPAGATSE